MNYRIGNIKDKILFFSSPLLRFIYVCDPEMSTLFFVLFCFFPPCGGGGLYNILIGINDVFVLSCLWCRPITEKRNKRGKLLIKKRKRNRRRDKDRQPNKSRWCFVFCFFLINIKINDESWWLASQLFGPEMYNNNKNKKKTQFFLGKKLDSSSEGSSAGLVFECWQQLKKPNKQRKERKLGFCFIID